MKKNQNEPSEDTEIIDRIKQLCSVSVGVVETQFLCQCLSILNPAEPICIKETASLREALDLLKTHKIGCLLVLDDKGKVSGIFTERDVILKVIGESKLPEAPISTFMTRQPVCEQLTTTIAFALNLMSHGGFRHIPIVDDEHYPIGIISVKNIVDYIVLRFLEDIKGLGM